MKEFLTDLEIASAASKNDINDIANSIGIPSDSLILYGNDMINGAKVIISLGVIWSLYSWIFKNPERPY